MNPKLKICGLMRQEDVAMCCDLGVDICGFVVEYPVTVPWNLTREQCATLLPSISADAKSCIVTGGDREKIISLALTLKPDLVQLHYHETLGDTASIVQALSPYGIGVIKTIPASPAERLQQLGVEEPALCARKLCAVGVYAILVDSRGPSNAANAGTMADLSLFHLVKATADRPVMLGGGITPENCSDVINRADPDIIDVMTGSEYSPGIKVSAKIRDIIDAKTHRIRE